MNLTQVVEDERRSGCGQLDNGIGQSESRGDLDRTAQGDHLGRFAPLGKESPAEFG